jgi:hypothetical protein
MRGQEPRGSEEGDGGPGRGQGGERLAARGFEELAAGFEGLRGELEEDGPREAEGMDVDLGAGGVAFELTVQPGDEAGAGDLGAGADGEDHTAGHGAALRLAQGDAGGGEVVLMGTEDGGDEGRFGSQARVGDFDEIAEGGAVSVHRFTLRSSWSLVPEADIASAAAQSNTNARAESVHRGVRPVLS